MNGMFTAKLTAALGLLAMTAILIYAFSSGDFAAEGRELLSMPWGIVSLVDLYTGFALFAGWILYREASRGVGLLWVVLLLVTGFWAGSLYALIALLRCGGDWHRFWLGARA